MAQWTGIDPNTLLPGDPWTSAKAQAAFENVEALAEGASGAPRVVPKALGGLILPAFSASLNNWAGLVDLDDYNELLIYAYGGGGGPILGGNVLEIRFSVDNGASWSSASGLLFLVEEDFTDYFIVRINLDTGANTRFFGSRGVSSAALTLPSGTVNGLQLRGAGGGSSIAGSAIVTGGRA